jgi:MAF protein
MSTLDSSALAPCTLACEDYNVRRLILASGSPRRRQLLSLLGLPFVIKAAGIDETQLDGEPPSEMVLRVSRAKAFAVRDVRADDLVIAADTVVVLDGEVLGKPAGPDDAARERTAARMLRDLRSRSHVVYSGVSVWHPASQCMVNELGQSTVWMRDYTDDEIDEYVASGDPLDKAGAYAIQHAGFAPASRVEGCWLNVMGLPLCHLGRALDRFGVAVPASVPPAYLPATCRAFSQLDCTAQIARPVAHSEGSLHEIADKQ